MTTRLATIRIYNDRLDKSSFIDFTGHNFAVITGLSGRGKSAIIDIINFCLLSGHCGIAKGVIRKNVTHVGISLELDDNFLGIIREIPAPRRKSSGKVFLTPLEGKHLPESVPDFTNYNLDTAKEALSDFVGISGLPVVENFNSTDPEEQRAVSIRHCHHYLFQPQDVIANRHVTFPGFSSYFHQRSALDALPYFVGVLTPESMVKRRRLRALVAELRRRERLGEEARRLGSDGYARGIELWQAARDLNLTDQEVPDDIPALQAALTELRDTPVEPPVGIDAADLQRLENEERALNHQAGKLQRGISRMKSFAQDEVEYNQVVSADLERLSIAELLGGYDDAFHCPLCATEGADASAITKSMKLAISHLETQASRPPSRVLEQVRSKVVLEERELKDVSRRLASVRSRIRSAYKEMQTTLPTINRTQKVASLHGRIREYLRGLGATIPREDDLTEMREEIKRLKIEVGDRAIQEKLKNVQDELSDDITRICEDLDVEFPGAPVTLDLDTLEIQVQLDPDHPTNRTPLSEIGSGANWVSYHVATAMALHRKFAQSGSSVPSLLVLDQPSQAWFPEESEALDAEMDSNNPQTDFQSVYGLLNVMYREANDQFGPQTIVLDHAKFKDKWFADSIVADWRGDDYLVPLDWIEADQPPDEEE